MISRTAEYALRAVAWLASHSDRTLSTHDFAGSTKVPTGYLSKVLQALARAGLVASTPGRTGGFSLARPPERISVLDVINAVGCLQRVQTCPLGAHGEHLCALHQTVDDVAAHAERAFAGVTMADVVKRSDTTGVLCETIRSVS